MDATDSAPEIFGEPRRRDGPEAKSQPFRSLGKRPSSTSCLLPRRCEVPDVLILRGALLNSDFKQQGAGSGAIAVLQRDLLEQPPSARPPPQQKKTKQTKRKEKAPTLLTLWPPGRSRRSGRSCGNEDPGDQPRRRMTASRHVKHGQKTPCYAKHPLEGNLFQEDPGWLQGDTVIMDHLW